MPIARKPQPVAPPAGVNFGRLSFYSGGSAIPEGDYAVTHDVMMHQATNRETGATRGPSRLGVMLSATLLNDPSAEPKQRFLAMGKDAHKFWAPNDTGKGLVEVPGSAAPATQGKMSNWAYYLKSLYDSGLPENVFENDLSTIDGAHVHLQNIDEPKDRKDMRERRKTQTGEGAMEEEEFSGPSTVVVVTQILDGGAPWEGGGGVPEAAAPAPAAKIAAKPVVAARPTVVARRPTPPPTPVAQEEAGEDADVEAAAASGVASVLEKFPNGCPVLQLKVGTFSYVKDNMGEEVATLVTSTYFGKDIANLNALLGGLGYQAAGGKVMAQ